jgi:hypothetical protein
LSPDQLLQLFEHAMGALWNRAHPTLGDVTLSAIMDRVLYNASERFSPFERLKVEPTGIDFRGFHEEGNVFDDDELIEGIQFVIVEFLVVIGNLTGEILTPALRSELSKITAKDSASGKHEKGKP